MAAMVATTPPVTPAAMAAPIGVDPKAITSR